MNLNQVTLPVKNISNAVAFYKLMGFQQIVDAPHYARFKSLQGEATFSLHHSEHHNGNGAIIYFECNELDKQVRELKKNGLLFLSEPKDETWLWREARILDPSNNEICLYYAGENRLNPPWRVD